MQPTPKRCRSTSFGRFSTASASRLVILGAGAFLTLLSGHLAAKRSRVIQEPVGVFIPPGGEQEVATCGLNSAFMLVHLYGIQVSPAEVRRVFPPVPTWLSLSEIKRGCERLGLSVAAINCRSPPERGLPVMPFIAHFGDTGALGHYVVVVRGDMDTITYLDGTTGDSMTVSRTDFLRRWSGYAIVPRVRREFDATQSELAAIGITYLLLLLLAAKSARAQVSNACRSPSRDRSMMRYRALTVGCMVLVVIIPVVAFLIGRPRVGGGFTMGVGGAVRDAEGASEWRTPSKDGINCLYVELRLLGLPAHYRAFQSEAESNPLDTQTIASLKRLAARFGYDLVACHLTAEQLADLSVPAILHEESDGVDSGHFCVYLTGDSASAYIVDGRSMCWLQVPRSRFVREWSGFALVPRPKLLNTDLIRRLIAFCAVCAIGGWFFAERARGQWASSDHAQTGRRQVQEAN